MGRLASSPTGADAGWLCALKHIREVKYLSVHTIQHSTALAATFDSPQTWRTRIHFPILQQLSFGSQRPDSPLLVETPYSSPCATLADLASALNLKVCHTMEQTSLWLVIPVQSLDPCMLAMKVCRQPKRFHPALPVMCLCDASLLQSILWRPPPAVQGTMSPHPAVSAAALSRHERHIP